MQVCARLRGGRGWVGFGATEESSSIKGLARAISYGRYQLRAVPPLLTTMYLRTAVVPSQRPPIEHIAQGCGGRLFHRCAARHFSLGV